VAKTRKVLWFLLIRVLGPIRPRWGSDLALAYYERMGMVLEGRPTFVASDAWFDSSKNYGLITLSQGCNISRDVRVLTHDWSPFCVLASLGREGRTSVGRLLPVFVGPHAFVGLGAILMPGSRVGKGAIIGAGSVVRGDVPEYAIVVGNPGQIVGDSREYVQKRFPEEWDLLPGS
jgi:acetyltransferase-like isoleucine patch superfamily enzyme